MTEPEYLTLEETAELLRQPVKTLYAWRTKGYGPPGRRVGKRILFRRSEVIAWAEAQVTTSGRPS